jgi:hypothetical protein
MQQGSGGNKAGRGPQGAKAAGQSGKAPTGEDLAFKAGKFRVTAVAFIKQEVDLWLQIVSKPVQFFGRMPTSGGFKQPGYFCALIAVINALVSLVLGMFHDPLAAVNAAGMTFLTFMVGAAIVAGIVFGLSRSFGGSGSFEAAYRAVCFSIAPAVVGWLPLINVIGGIYSVFLLKLSLERAQGISAGRATAVVGIVVALCLGAGVLLVFNSVAGMLGSHTK